MSELSIALSYILGVKNSGRHNYHTHLIPDTYWFGNNSMQLNLETPKHQLARGWMTYTGTGNTYVYRPSAVAPNDLH